jgi:hydrogenase expression/formation protein HypE
MGFYVYMLRCADASYYVGHTDELEGRVSAHERGEIPGYTHSRRPVRLVFANEFATREEALARERQIKGWSRAKKEALIRGNWGRLQRPTFSGQRKRARASAHPSTPPPAGGSAQDSLASRPPSTSSGRTEPGGRIPVGKLPNDLLSSLLKRIEGRDPRVIIGPGIGRDAAVIDAGGTKLLVAKSDPVTFASDMIGWYAVHVNANDIACTGATPQWFLATVLLPEAADALLAESVFDQLVDACSDLSIELVGGHTEIAFGLTRPIVVGAMLGEVERDRLVRPDGGRPGDVLILTKGIAIEGTGVLAREAGARLQRLGVAAEEIEEAKRYIVDPGISVLKEAIAACDAAQVHAMHDPTEGGLATALHEMAEASHCGIIVRADAIDALPLTQRVCDASNLDPIGLLASGALLLAVAEEDYDEALGAIEKAGVPARRIGLLASAEVGVIMEDNRGRSYVPRFPRDEVARFLTQPD